MNENEFDKKVEEVLHKNTDDATALKEDTFKNIMSKIEKIEKEDKIMKRKSRSTKIAGIVVIGFFTAMALLATTNSGKAAIGKIRELFAPEKKIQQELEGNKEGVDLGLEEKMDYIIYIDKSIYKMESKDGIDRIVPKETFIEGLPEISITIEQREKEKPQAIADQLMKELESKFVKLEKVNVKDPIPSIMIFGHGGFHRESVIQRYYLIDNTKGGTFVITQTYFLEASEGHGTRFDNMVREFRVVPE